MGKKNKAAKKGGEAAGSTCRAADGGGDANTAAANDSSAAAAAASGGKGKRKSDIDDIFGAIAGDGASKKGKAAQVGRGGGGHFFRAQVWTEFAGLAEKFSLRQSLVHFSAVLAAHPRQGT